MDVLLNEVLFVIGFTFITSVDICIHYNRFQLHILLYPWGISYNTMVKGSPAIDQSHLIPEVRAHEAKEQCSTQCIR